MKAVLKFPLEVVDRQSVPMPAGAEILYVEMQHGKPTLWALCSDTEQSDLRKIAIRGTGHPISADLVTKEQNYIGTCIDRERGLVWHVFEGELE